MASPTAPPVIPITNSPAAPTAQQQQTQAPINTGALRSFLSRLSDSSRRSLSNGRPWQELLDRSAFSRPESLSDATSRLRKNLSYFRVNYLLIFAAVLAFSLITNPFSLLLLLALLAAWSFLYAFRSPDQPLVLLGRQFSDREAFVGLVALTIVVVFLTNVASLLMSAVVVGAGIVCLHGAFRVPEDLFLDDQEATSGAGGFLSSFLGGGPSTVVAPAVAPAVAARV